MTPRGATLSLPAKLALLSFAVLTAAWLAQLALLDALAGARPAVRAAAIGAVIVGPPSLVVLALGRYLVGRLTMPVIAAYQRVAAGDLRAELPPMTAGRDFLGLREAFAAMGAALERSLTQVRDADADRRRLFSDLAHELATPTSTLLGIAAGLRRGDGARGWLLDHLEHESHRLERLIADVREVAHLEDPSLPLAVEPADVGALARRAVERARLAHGDACALRCEAEVAVAAIDPARVDQVLVNLVENAVRHAAGGAVAVTVRGGDVVVLRVEDSGPGVPDALLPSLGRRLLRVDPSRSRATGGHGLGLSIVRAIVARHGGEVVFGRAALGGLAVEVHLPCDHGGGQV